MSTATRTTFGRLGVVLATIGSAVGLGNIWRFPYMLGTNGGGAFLLIYILCVLLLGLPAVIAEFFIGRHTQRNAAGAFKAIAPGIGSSKKCNMNPIGLWCALHIGSSYSINFDRDRKSVV